MATRATSVLPLLALGCSLAAVEPPVPLVPPPQIVIALDHDAAAPGGKAAKPLSLWSDPAAAPTLAHIGRQLALLSGGRIPADADLGAWRALGLSILPPSPTDPDPLRARFALLLRHPLAAALRDAVAAGILSPKPAKIGLLDGQGNPGFFVGSAGEVFGAGDPQLLAAPAPPMPAGAQGAALWLACDLGPTLALVKSLEPDGISYGLDPLLPRWRDEAPQLTIRAVPAGDAWEATLALKASQLPFHAIDPALTKLGRSGKHARLALGVDPRAVAGLIANLLDEAGERALAAKLGMPLADVAATFTGDVLAMVDASGIIPQGCIALQLAPGHDAKPFAAAIAAAWKGQTAAMSGADDAWVLDTPIGPWGLALGKRLLVIGNDPDLAQQLLGGAAGDAAIAPGKAVVIDIDLPLLSKQWLPLAWRLLGEAHLDLGEDPLAAMRFRMPEAATALIQTVGPEAKLSLLLQEPAPSLMLSRGEARVVWMLPPQFVAQAQALLGDGDLGAALDQSLACFVDPGAHPAEVLASVMREADGFHVLEDDRRGKRVALNPAQLTQRLGSLTRALGPDPAQLRQVAPPPRPSLDRRWLPEPAVIQRHLPPYHLEVEMTADGVEARESGLPLGTAAAAAAIAYLGIFQQPRMHQYHVRFSGQQQPAPAQPPATPGTVEF